ncbi:MAG: barstar family protein [Bdellovibrionales bacterium]|nr:barstar family protein [Bdellovibrionales bacterium]
MMKSITIDCSKVKNENDFHEVFATLDITPNYYGKNLNALWDVLTTDIEGPVMFMFENHKEFELANTSDYEKIISLFKEAQSERPTELSINLS